MTFWGVPGFTGAGVDSVVAVGWGGINGGGAVVAVASTVGAGVAVGSGVAVGITDSTATLADVSKRPGNARFGVVSPASINAVRNGPA